MPRTTPIALASAAALALSGSALAADASPAPAHCDYSVKKTVSFATAKRKGIPVTVTCDGPARVSSIFMLTGKPERDWDDRYRNVRNPPESVPHPTDVTAGQAAITRVTLTRNAASFLSHYPRPRVRVLLGVQPPGKKYFSSVDSGKLVTLK